MKNKWVWFDMDGTIADLYGVENWLSDIENYNTRPYENAESIYKDLELLSIMADLKSVGYSLGIISWSSKAHNSEFDKRVEKAKKEWLYNRGYDLLLDKIIVAPYGERKADICRLYGYGILVDDELNNRKEWDLGSTINAETNIIKQLKKLL